ncbi:MAG: Gfo/Idh/MocA family oxidoreductase, partial [Spirochaetaceae bacterium]|nr:Gfo/Idh/MocA family oxidoreductase [Spirochaetaceae bacterium]
IGLVGCGQMGGHYADVFQKMNDVSVVACCDPTPPKLKTFSEEKGIPRSYVDYRRMLMEEHLDGVLNVTPDFLHAEVAGLVLHSGIPLMTEKPLAGDLESCRSLLDTAVSSGIPNVVNFSKRHASAVETARILVTGGSLGHLKKIDASYLQGWVYTMDWGDWREVHAWTWRLNREFAPLGVLGDLGSHLIDLLTHITGGNVVQVSDSVLGVVDKGIERVGGLLLDSPDFASASLELTESIPVSFKVSRIDSGHKDDLILVFEGEDARLSINLSRDRKNVRLVPYKPQELPENCLDPETLKPIGSLMAEMEVEITTHRPKTNYQHFADILNGRPAAAPGITEGFTNLAVLDAVLASSGADGTPVRPDGFPE